MPTFENDGVTISYIDEGDDAGEAIVLVHGFASNRAVNWVNTSWLKTLTGAGMRVLALDNRGHGQSEKLYEPDAYRSDKMASDVLALIDAAGLQKAVLMGYSMGARICAFATLAAPQKVRALVLSGLAANLVHGVGGAEPIAAALRAPSARDVTDPDARAFRIFADQTKSDREALAACILAARQKLSAEDIAKIAVPTLVVAGSDDHIAGSADELAALIPGAEPVTLEGRDHMTAVGDKAHKAAVLSFLEGLEAR